MLYTQVHVIHADACYTRWCMLYALVHVIHSGACYTRWCMYTRKCMLYTQVHENKTTLFIITTKHKFKYKITSLRQNLLIHNLLVYLTYCFLQTGSCLPRTSEELADCVHNCRCSRCSRCCRRCSTRVDLTPGFGVRLWCVQYSLLQQLELRLQLNVN